MWPQSQPAHVKQCHHAEIILFVLNHREHNESTQIKWIYLEYPVLAPQPNHRICWCKITQLLDDHPLSCHNSSVSQPPIKSIGRLFSAWVVMTEIYQVFLMQLKQKHWISLSKISGCCRNMRGGRGTSSFSSSICGSSCHTCRVWACPSPKQLFQCYWNNCDSSSCWKVVVHNWLQNMCHSFSHRNPKTSLCLLSWSAAGWHGYFWFSSKTCHRGCEMLSAASLNSFRRAIMKGSSAVWCVVFLEPQKQG